MDSGNCSYETLMTRDGNAAPADAIDELTRMSFVETSFIETGQFRNRPLPKQTALFILNPDHPAVRDCSGPVGVPLRVREMPTPAVPRPGNLRPVDGGHAESKESQRRS